MKTLSSLSAMCILAMPVFATDITTIEIAESEEFGQYLADSDGRPVYVFSTDTPASEDAQAKISCISEECIDAWPLMTTAGDPQAGAGVDAELLGMIEADSRQVVTYQGWPLYYSAHDESGQAPQDSTVEGFGGQWSLVPVAAAGDGDIAAGQALYAADCAQCHGRTGRGMASFPSIQGHEADYISDILMRYRAGETIGSNTALMRPVAAALSDTDIADLAAFISAEFQ